MNGLKGKYPQAVEAVVERDPENAIAAVSTSGGDSELPLSKGESSATILDPNVGLNVTHSVKNTKVGMFKYHKS